MVGPDLRPGKINSEGGEPEKGAPDVGKPPQPSDSGDEPFPPDPVAQEEPE